MARGTKERKSKGKRKKGNDTCGCSSHMPKSGNNNNTDEEKKKERKVRAQSRRTWGKSLYRRKRQVMVKGEERGDAGIPPKGERGARG